MARATSFTGVLLTPILQAAARGTFVDLVNSLSTALNFTPVYIRSPSPLFETARNWTSADGNVASW